MDIVRLKIKRITNKYTYSRKSISEFLATLKLLCVYTRIEQISNYSVCELLGKEGTNKKKGCVGLQSEDWYEVKAFQIKTDMRRNK